MTLDRICREPVFVIGSPRSGTTILALSLACHSALWTSGESDFLYHLFRREIVDNAYGIATSRPFNWLVQEQVGKSEFLQSLGLGVNALFTERSGGARWVEQTPLYTLMIDVIADMFPDAKFVHILRDGRQVVRSMLSFGHARTKDRWVHDFRTACQTWATYVDAAGAFAAEHPDHCLTIRYDALASQPERAFAEVFEFLDLPYEDEPARHVISTRVNSSFPRAVRDGRGRDAPDPWDEWTDDQRAIFVSAAADALRRQGLIGEEEFAAMARETSVVQDDLAERIRAAVRDVIAPDATVLVISRGDETLRDLDGRDAWHFPRGGDGEYAGHYPATSDEAIGHLEVLRNRGAEFLVIPRTAFWWLDFYDAFRAFLEQRYAIVADRPECRIFRLAPGAVSVEPSHAGRVEV